MLAAVLEGVKKMVLREIEKPKAGYGEVVVQVKACGICQTDYSAYTGRRRNWKPGIIIGHEMSGIVDEVGEGVNRFKEGDEVVISPAVYCGYCDYCKKGLQHYCPNGFSIGGEGFDNVWNGGFAEFTKAPESALYQKPDNISFEVAALAEPLAGSYKGMILYSQMTLGEVVVIIGAGAMGLLLTQVAKAAGAGHLILIDVEDFKLKYAKKCGATEVINLRREDPKKAVYKIIPQGPDLIFEAAGVLDGASLAMELCRRGSRVNMFGVIIPGTIPISPADVHFTEIRMDASFSVTPRVMLKSLDLMKKRLVDPEKIITHKIPLSKIDDALEVMTSTERIKVVVLP